MAAKTFPLTPDKLPNAAEYSAYNRQKMEAMSPEQMHDLIHGLPVTQSMHEGMYVGIEFMDWLVDNYGVKAASSFVDNTHRMLCAQGVMMNYDFDKFKLAAEHENGGIDAVKGFKSVGKIHKLNRRDFMRTAGWLGPGIVVTTVSGLRTLDDLFVDFCKATSRLDHPDAESSLSSATTASAPSPNAPQDSAESAPGVARFERRELFTKLGRWSKRHVPPAPNTSEQSSLMSKTADVVDHNLTHPSETLLGGALIYEGMENWKQIKLTQIANIASEMAEALELQPSFTVGRQQYAAR